MSLQLVFCQNHVIYRSGRADAEPEQEDCQMEERKKPLPIGIEFFRDFKSNDYYYVDKTAFIAEFLRTKGAVNLFTRPRRFGKSLNMNMLKTFF